MTVAVAMPATGALEARPQLEPADVTPYRRPPLRLFVILSLLLVSTVAWRRGVYYSGGFDVVVAAKALLDVVALALAWGAFLGVALAGAWNVLQVISSVMRTRRGSG